MCCARVVRVCTRRWDRITSSTPPWRLRWSGILAKHKKHIAEVESHSSLLHLYLAERKAGSECGLLAEYQTCGHAHHVIAD